MSLFRRYSQAGGAIHDLEHLAGLSADRTIPLLVSPKVLYLIQNFAGQDVAFECRWAVERKERGYLRLTSDDAEYPDFLELVHDVGVQTSERAAGMGTLFNFKEPLVVGTLNTNASAGSNTLSIQPPEGETWVIEFASAVNVNTVCSAILFTGELLGGIDVWLDRRATPAAGLYQTLKGPITLANETQINAVFEGCSAGDDLYFRAYGYIMDRPA